MIKYVKGDATNPPGPGFKLIIHCCNDIGAWGAGFVMALSARYPQAREAYLDWSKNRDYICEVHTKFELGGWSLVSGCTKEDHEPRNTYEEGWIWIANMIGQHGVGRDHEGNPPIRYEAIELGFKRISTFIKRCLVENRKEPISVHMPRLGCGLAGGDWMRIECLINKYFINQGISVTVYDL